MAKRPPNIPPRETREPAKMPVTGMEEFEALLLSEKPHDYHDLIHARKNRNIPRVFGEKQGKLFVYQDKSSGIEPGFTAFVGDEKFYSTIKKFLIERLQQAKKAFEEGKPNWAYDLLPFHKVIEQSVSYKSPNLKAHRESIQKQYETYLEQLAKAKTNLEYNYILKKFFGFDKGHADQEFNKNCEHILMNDFVAWRKNLPENQKPDLILVKGDFANGTLVSVGEKRTLLTSTMQKIRKLSNSLANFVSKFYNLAKSGFKSTKNADFTKETIVNNIALVHGIQGHPATIKVGAYSDGTGIENGTPMLVNAQVWAKGFRPFEGLLQGGTVKAGTAIAKELSPEMTKELNLAEKNLPSLSKITHRSDNTIGGIPQSLAFFLVAGDYDMLGTKGGNKGIVNNELYAIDFGHSFEGNNGILANLRDDFRFKQPKKTIKHIDAFYDHPLSEMMQGVYLLMKQHGQKIPDAVIHWYQEKAKSAPPEDLPAKQFLQKLDNTTPGSAVHIFDTYIKNFEAAEKKFPKQYNGYAKKVKELKKEYLARSNQFLKVFEKRMGLTPDELTLLENMEKLLCNKKHIKNTSADGTVLLNHLRVDIDHRVPCQMVQDKDPNFVNFIIEAKNSEHRLNLEKTLDDFVQNAKNEANKNGSELNINLNFQRKSNKLLVKCPATELPNLMKALEERNVARHHGLVTAETLEKNLAQKPVEPTPQKVAAKPADAQPTKKVTPMFQRHQQQPYGEGVAKQPEPHIAPVTPKVPPKPSN